MKNAHIKTYISRILKAAASPSPECTYRRTSPCSLLGLIDATVWSSKGYIMTWRGPRRGCLASLGVTRKPLQIDRRIRHLIKQCEVERPLAKSLLESWEPIDYCKTKDEKKEGRTRSLQVASDGRIPAHLSPHNGISSTPLRSRSANTQEN